MKKNNIKSKPKPNIYPEGTLICSVCGKEFEANDKTRFIIAGGYTCSLKCFTNEAKKRDAIRKENEKNKINKRNKKGK